MVFEWCLLILLHSILWIPKLSPVPLAFQGVISALISNARLPFEFLFQIAPGTPMVVPVHNYER